MNRFFLSAPGKYAEALILLVDLRMNALARVQSPVEIAQVGCRAPSGPPGSLGTRIGSNSASFARTPEK
jgi:hypothetical protein